MIDDTANQYGQTFDQKLGAKVLQLTTPKRKKDAPQA
jgi:hypothetical protein